MLAKYHVLPYSQISFGCQQCFSHCPKNYENIFFVILKFVKLRIHSDTVQGTLKKALPQKGRHKWKKDNVVLADGRPTGTVE